MRPSVGARVADSGNDQIGLAEAISRVRSELMAAQRADANEQLRFRLGQVQMEFTVELAREGGAEAGVKLWVVNVGTKGSRSSTHSNKVTVSMTPQTMNAAGEWVDVRVADAPAGRPPVPGAAADVDCS